MTNSKPVSAVSSQKLTDDDENKFVESFEKILTTVTPSLLGEGGLDVEDGMEWLRAVMKYNVPSGKQIRGRLAVLAYKLITGGTATDKNMELARILGWSVEILQACFLVADDIMDRGVTRRGKMCWHRVNNMGNIAFNDAFLLEHISLQLLRIHFGGSEIYSKILDLVLGVSFRTMLGQSIDTRMGKYRNFDQYTLHTYKTMVTYKTGYYTVYLPIALAMLHAGFSPRDDVVLFKEVESISLKIGYLFQMQDDFLDVFGNERELGKVGTDIQEGKCTWIFVTAVQKCCAEELKILKQNYGSEDKKRVEMVKGIYDKLEIPEEFAECQRKLVSDILGHVETLNHAKLQTVFQSVVHSIYKRKY